jgi:RNA polymerase-associated protein CTR9
LLLLAKNSIEPAGYLFKFCLEKTPNSLPALMGQACVHFFSGNFRTALQAFQSLLKSFPQFNEFRVAIGYCFHRLGFAEMAVKAFSRVLQVDPGCEAALLALGFLALDRGDESGIQSGLMQMKGVFELNRNCAVAQVHLANHFFFKRDLDKAKLLAESAIQNATNDKIKAEAFFIGAKVSHVSGNFSDALAGYQMASRLAPEFLPALFGLGQCFLARGDLNGALMMFDRILESNPTCPEVLRLVTLIHCALASLDSPKSSSPHPSLTEALKLIPKAIEFFPKDKLLLQCAAILHEQNDPIRALEFYSAADIQESNNFAQLNNFVVLKNHHHHHDESKNLENDRLLLKRSQDLATSDSLRTLIRFNEARIIEECTSDDHIEIYREILKSNPNFPLAHLRLGICCFKGGQLAEAADHFKDVIGNDNHNRDAWNCLAATHLKQKAFTPARKSFERVLQTIDKDDPYALVSLGNIYIELARTDKSRKHLQDYHKRALEFFSKASNLKGGNIYAAQGIGVLFAERGLTADARDVFTTVRAHFPDSLQTSLNYAHTLIESAQYSGAATVYTSILAGDHEETPGKTVSLLLFLCRALYLLALDSHDFTAADTAINYAQKALKLLPKDEPLKFNLGLLLQARASAILSSPPSEESASLIASALTSLTQAEEIFAQLSPPTIDEKLLASRKKMSVSLSKALHESAKNNERTIKEQTERLDQLKLQRQEQSQKDSLARAQMEALERQRLAQIEQSRRELAQKMKETEEKIKAATNTATSTRKSHNQDDSASSDDEEEAQKTTRRKKRSKIESDLENNNSDQDDLDGITKGGRRQRSKAKASSSTAPLLSKEYISSSEDEQIDDHDNDESFSKSNNVPSEDDDEKSPLYPSENNIN